MSSKAGSRLISCFLLLLSAACPAGDVPFPPMELSGEAASILVPNSTTAILRPFRVSLSGSQWEITAYESTLAQTNTQFYWKTFNLTEQSIVQSYWNPRTKLEYAQLKPLVAPVACPDGVSHFLWLALTPSISSDEQGEVDLPPLYDSAADLGTNPDLRRKCRVEYLDNAKLFLRRIRFFNDGTYNRHINGTNIANKYARPYDKGFLEAEFETISFTNWNGINIPLKFKGTIFRTGLGRSPEDLIVAHQVELTVTAVHPLAANIKLPPAPRRGTVFSDRRVPLHPNQPVSYILKQPSWPTLEKSRAEAVIAKTPPKRRMSRGRAVLFMILILVPAVVILIRGRFPRNQNSSHQ
jgi:hypothetical protein